MYDRKSVEEQQQQGGQQDLSEDLGQQSALGQSRELAGYTQDQANDAIPMFLNESEDPLVRDQGDGSGNKEIRYERTVKAHPTLRFADDDSMAVQAEGHAKELFATDTVLGASELGLGEHESGVVLLRTGNSISVDGKTLHQVKPGLSKNGLDQAVENVANLSVDRCVGLAAKIEGGSETRQTLVQRNDEGTTRKNVSVGSANSDDLDRMAIEISREVEDRTLGETEELPKDLGAKYGKLARDPKFQSIAKQRGINEFAKPKVGEMLGIFSIWREARKEGFDPKAPIKEQMQLRQDFTGGGKGEEREFSWGYHYAGVVATSTTGDDYVTLENYNRSSDMEEAMQTAVDQLVQAKGSKISRWYMQQKLKGKTPREQLEVMVKDKVGSDKQAIKDQLDRTLDAKHGTAWYFAMYGSKKGQSFHEKNAATGYFANPMTVVTSSDDSRALNQARTYVLSGQIPQVPGTEGEVKPLNAAWLEEAKRVALETGNKSAVQSVNRKHQAIIGQTLAPDLWRALVEKIEDPQLKWQFFAAGVSLQGMNTALNDLEQALQYRDDGDTIREALSDELKVCDTLLKWVVRS